MKSIYVHTNISKPYDVVYGFISKPENFPLWASGLAEGEFRKDGDLWLAITPMGEMRIRCTAENEFGIVDHWVIPPTGAEMYNPLRVIKNGDGCDVVFTLFQRAEMNDEELERDKEWIAKDLSNLKKLLESK